VTVGEPAAAPSDLIEVGRVADAWGVRGWIRIEPFNHPSESVLLRVRDWWLVGPGAPPSGPVRVTRCRVHGDVLVAKPTGSEDRDQALRFRGAGIQVSRAEFPEPPEGEVYWVDLIGCSVTGLDGVELGTVERVEDHGAHPILFVRQGERLLLIPFVEQIVTGVDIVGRRLVADWAADY
jgi:16S rRNA processing protein RimM